MSIQLIYLFALTIMNLQQKSWYIETIPPTISEEMLSKRIISADAPVGINRLSLVHIEYYDVKGDIKKGQLIVLDVVSPAVLEIFKELYEKKFPLEEVSLITKYDGNDDRSMEANNTSAHNFRKVAGSTRLSLHSYGTAIDINPLFNPYIIFNEEGTAKYLPPKSVKYANRNIKRPGKVTSIGYAEEVVEIFARHGFYNWGGYWDSPIDYQHFQLDRQISYILAACKKEEGEELFQLLRNFWLENAKFPEDHLRSFLSDQDLYNKFSQDPTTFIQWVKIHINHSISDNR